MLPAFRFVGASWKFFWRQPALRTATIALVFFPLLAMSYLDMDAAAESAEHAAVLVVLYIGAAVILTWGTACILIVARRLLQAKAGRLRTSFKAVRGHAAGMIVSIILTEILRGCITLLWSLPAVALAIYALSIIDVPQLLSAPFDDQRPFFFLLGICLLLVLPAVYAMLTSLSSHVVVFEKVAFRQALKRSRQLTQAHAGRTLVVTAILGLFWLLSPLADLAFQLHASADARLFVAPIVRALCDTTATVVWYLGLTQFYKALGGKAKPSSDDVA